MIFMHKKRQLDMELREMTSKFSAKRAGDYYMFEYNPATDELVQPVESFIPEPTPGATRFDKLDPTQVRHFAKNQNVIKV